MPEMKIEKTRSFITNLDAGRRKKVAEKLNQLVKLCFGFDKYFAGFTAVKGTDNAR